MDIVGAASLHHLLRERAQARPEHDFIVFESRDADQRSVTYAGFLEDVERCAAALEQTGIGPGDAVVIHVGASIEFLVCWFALARLGAVSVPTNLASAAPEITHAIAVSGARHAITEPTYAGLIGKAVADSEDTLDTLITVRGREPSEGAQRLEDLLAAVPEGARAQAPLPGALDVAEVLFTSGTTSRPKGAQITHANLVRAGERVAKHYALTDEDRPMALLPLFHVGGQAMGVMCTLAVGGTCVLIEQYSASSFWRQAREHEATFVMIVSTHVRTLLAQEPSDDDGSHPLRRVAFGLKITDDERDRFEERFGVRLTYCYGQTEAILLIAIAPLFGPRRWPAVGLPAFDREVRLLDDDGEEVREPGEVGEILVAADPGRTVMKGYANDPEATAAALKGGWLRTGDYGAFDERGYLHFADRKKDMIKRSGENVSALEVETVLTAHPEIADAAVVGVPDPVRDEAVKAFVVLAPGAEMSEEDVAEHCRGYLAAFKVPSLIDFLDALPKTSIGKTEKSRLRG